VAPGAEVAGSPQEVLDRFPDCWVIGGGAVYQAMTAHADHVVRTEVDARFEGDAFAPVLGPQWRQIERRPDQGWSLSRDGLRFAVTEFHRIRGQ